MSARARVISVVVVAVVLCLVVTGSAAVLPGAVSSSAAAAEVAPGARVIDSSDPPAVAVSREFFSSSPEAVLVGDDADPAAWRDVETTAPARHLPVFRVDADHATPVADELLRLGVTRVHRIGSVPEALTAGRTVVDDLGALTGNEMPQADRRVVLVTRSAGPDAVATARAAGRTVVLPVADPRATGEAAAALGAPGVESVRAVGAEFGDDELFAARVEQATTGAQLPGGGQLVFPMRRMVALYGSPGVPALGPLGRQDIPASIARAKRLAAQYQRFSKVPVLPAFEIIVTVASAEAGPGATYTNMIDPAEIEPWVAAAGRAGVYVTLDLQPGRMDFLTQAKRYAGLLAQPHVGLALDPEWRLKPHQVHLTQIGSVAAAEVNRTAEWLATFTRERRLPQKLLVLHQFDSDMLADRKTIRTDHPELQVLIHADGHGVPGVKMDTWRRLITDLPPGVWMGWKNFYTEDKPTFTPAQTVAVRPEPWFISYQ